MKTYLVTGAAGFIGANYIKYLLHRKYKNEEIKVIVLDLLTYAGNLGTIKDDIDNDRCIFVRGDIRDRELADRLFTEYDIDYVVNFAAESHVDRSIKDPFTFAQTNVMGTLSMLQAAKDYWENQSVPWVVTKADGESVPCRFYHISTDEVYGALELTNPEGVASPFTTKASSDHHHAYGDTFFTEETKYNPIAHIARRKRAQTIS